MITDQTPRKDLTRDIRQAAQFKPRYVHTTRPYIYYFRTQTQIDRFPFDPGYIDSGLYEVDYNIQTSKGLYRRIPPKTLRPKDVFLTESILPYSISLTRAQCGSELDVIAPQIQKNPRRIPALYRITDRASIDDYGRFFILNDRGLWELYLFRLSGNMRTQITLPGNSTKSITRPCYVFSALSGYNPYDQATFLFSQEYEFHHVEENRMDIRPNRVVPLEYRVHKYIHSNDINPKHRDYFKYKQWLIYSKDPKLSHSTAQSTPDGL